MNKWRSFILTAGGLVLADQLTKLVVVGWLAPIGRLRLLPGLFDLSLVMNTGVAFGMFAGARNAWRITILTGFNLAALGLMLFALAQAKVEEKYFIYGLALVAGGAIGNALDRLRLGAVIDFLDLHIGNHYWPTFNVADIGICLGAALILLHLWKNR